MQPNCMQGNLLKTMKLLSTILPHTVHLLLITSTSIQAGACQCLSACFASLKVLEEVICKCTVNSHTYSSNVTELRRADELNNGNYILLMGAGSEALCLGTYGIRWWQRATALAAVWLVTLLVKSCIRLCPVTGGDRECILTLLHFASPVHSVL